jgi:hypothetical protein
VPEVTPDWVAAGRPASGTRPAALAPGERTARGNPRPPADLDGLAEGGEEAVGELIAGNIGPEAITLNQLFGVTAESPQLLYEEQAEPVSIIGAHVRALGGLLSTIADAEFERRETSDHAWCES